MQPSTSLKEFEGSKIPIYAILPHMQGENEITLQDIETSDVEKMVGYEKIRNTCCIDKTSSAGFSEAINSMYRWYQESGLCYVYLADVPSDTADPQIMIQSPEFSMNRWFTGGWTLQELIAPSVVIFLDQGWRRIGTAPTHRLHSLSF